MVRGGYTTAAASKVEHIVIIDNSWKPLTIITKGPILDVIAVLDPPLQGLSLTKLNRCKFSYKLLNW